MMMTPPSKYPADESNQLGIGANNIKIFAISDSVLKPDFYESSFIVTDNKNNLPSIKRKRNRIC